ncbi:MAG: HAMP domain-containing sensor histidine kinase [Balneola sp.]
MQNKWTIYSFLGIMIAALITLAVLQYHWLGSVSDAEKKRLEENLEASTENFVSDLNKDFSALNQAFKIQVTNTDSDIDAMIGRSYLNWLSNTEYPQLIDSVYFVQNTHTDSPTVKLFQTDPVRLLELSNSGEVKKWLSKKSDIGKHRTSSFNLLNTPDFGTPTFIGVPIQLLDLVTLENESLGRNLKVNLNIDQSDDIVLLQLDDSVIKNNLIPDIARTYFSDSFSDQYHISIIKENNADSTEVYFSTNGSESVKEADFKKDLRSIDFSSVFVIQSQANLNTNEGLFKSIDSLSSKIQSINITGGSPRKSYKMMAESSQVRFNTRTSDSVFTVQKDTTINTSFEADFSTAGWQFWLSFKEGSLDTFVTKAKNRNLAISFGILLILGFCVGMIVLYSKRSQDLAEKQMLFVAGVSHELRTPLTVIRSAAENLNEGVVQSEERKKEYARLMLKEGRRLSDMVDQIMEFSGIQAGKKVYSFTEFEVEELMNEILSEYRSVLEDEGVQLEYSFTASKSIICADRDALHLSISNLLSNAIKFCGESMKIRFAVAEIAERGLITFIVQDYGMGIPLEEQKNVFKPFFRGKKPVDNQVKGNGIGLSLVKKVADAHKGEIRLKSKEGEGSTFILMLPVKGHE